MDCGPFFFRACPVRMHLDDRAIQRNGLHLDSQNVLFLKRSEDSIQHPRLCPPIHPRVHGVPVAEPLRQATPLASVFCDVKDRIQHGEIRDRHVPALGREASLNPLKLLI